MSLLTIAQQQYVVGLATPELCKTLNGKGYMCHSGIVQLWFPSTKVSMHNRLAMTHACGVQLPEKKKK
jgi:hypothetical protein